MTISLDRLPFDVLFHTASYLQFDDIVHLSHTCRQLKTLLYESTLCQRTIKDHAPHSKEAQLAKEGNITYGEAVQSVYARRDAFSQAHPFSARIVGHGSSYLYRQGILCLLHGSILRVLDLHYSGGDFDVDICDIIRPLSPGSSEEPKLSLLYYSNSIIVVHFERNGRQSGGRLLAINTEKDMANAERLVKTIPLESSSRIFVRHTASYLYYGTYSGDGDDGHREWELRGVCLDPNLNTPSQCVAPLQLVNFFGTDIGSTVAFEIHNGHFYAVSNQTSFDVEELDWTSFYHCVRFPLENPTIDAMEVNSRIYRRQHSEGPIHDSWTDLSIQIDEREDEPVIVESRREWQNGSTRQLRAFYTTRIQFELTDEALLPEDDPFVELLDCSNNPNYAPARARLASDIHKEFGPACISSRSFILARTKFRAYNYSCSSFIDLVEDDRCCPDPSIGPCLRIRVGSRRTAPLGWTPDDTPGSSKGKAKATSTPEPDVGVEYRHSPIKLWPPPAARCPCAQRLHKIMSPHGYSGRGNTTITGVVDERSLVYMVKSGRSYGADDTTLGTVVLVSFNRDVRGPLAASCQDADMEGHDSPTDWHWSPGQSTRCKKGEC